jgi:UPF0716 family protein affecting phage T7 exclusion
VGRVHSAVVLKFFVVPIVGILWAGVVIGKTWLVITSFGVLVVTLRMQRKQEMKRLHGYHRRRRNAKRPIRRD